MKQFQNSMTITTQKQPKNMWKATSSLCPNLQLAHEKTEAQAVATLLGAMWRMTYRRELSPEEVLGAMFDSGGIKVVRL